MERLKLAHVNCVYGPLRSQMSPEQLKEAKKKQNVKLESTLVCIMLCAVVLNKV